MKKIFLIATMFVGCATHVFSQARFGLQAGANMSFTQMEINGEDDLSNKAKFGIAGGFLADIPMGPVSFRPEIGFIQKGFKNTYSGGDQYAKVRLNYIEVPLNFVYNIPAGTGKVYIGLGPNFGFGLSGKSRYYVNSALVESKDVKFDGDTDDPNGNNDHLKRFDFGGNVLAGYTCGMGLTFGVSFTLGLSDVSPNKLDSNDPNADGFTEKNHSLNFKIGYLFGGSSESKKTSTGSGTTGSGSF